MPPHYDLFDSFKPEHNKHRPLESKTLLKTVYPLCDAVGAAVGTTVGAAVGAAVGATLGACVGAAVGVAVGATVGAAVTGVHACGKKDSVYPAAQPQT